MIKTTSEESIQSKLYPVPIAQQEACKEEIRQLLHLNIIRASTSEDTLPAFLLLKKQGNKTGSRLKKVE